MPAAKHTQFINATEIEEFVAAPTSKDRMKIMTRWAEKSLKIDDDFLRGLLKFPLTQDEILLAIDLCDTRNRAEFELWIMDNILTWDQNIAASAIRAWERASDRILWHRLIPLASSPGLPQRIRFTILDIAPSSHGFEIVSAILRSQDWEELSPAFHGLLFERCLQFDLGDPRLNKLAWKILEQNKQANFPEDKSLIPAIGWLCKHEEANLEKWTQQAPKNLWINVLSSVIETHGRRFNEMSKIEKMVSKSSHKTPTDLKLPALWSRGEFTAAIYTHLIKLPKSDSSLIEGIPAQIISNDDYRKIAHNSWADDLIGRLPFGPYTHMTSDDQTSFAKSYDQSKYAELYEARTLAVSGKLGLVTDKINQAAQFCDEKPILTDETTGHSFLMFLEVLCDQNFVIGTTGGTWDLLAKAWLSPASADLNALTSSTRKGRGLQVLAHIMVMSRMTGRDDAVLKLLDHIRSNDEIEIRSVVRALGMINTPRSLLELIGMITRPNASIIVKQDIVGVLVGKDLTSLQKELRSAVQDLLVPENTDHPLYQIKDDLSAMLLPNEERDVKIGPAEATDTPKEGSLDLELSSMIPNYNHLSSEVKRALRTALFFNRTVTTSKHANAIDLSPLIDMQYKAMELLYREFFEDLVSQILQKGTIQRKLDVLGYARPIIRSMDEFESFIASLPVVKEIPFFSKFKLRKMLRALCQFEPGKRFTLDGLKAFGLFFIVFGRQSCRHGLAGIVVTGAKDDQELAEFCRELHIFQDFRNRAAHEGFHPDASNDILGIWRTTALLVQWAFKAKSAQKTDNTTPLRTAS